MDINLLSLELNKNNEDDCLLFEIMNKLIHIFVRWLYLYEILYDIIINNHETIYKHPSSLSWIVNEHQHRVKKLHWRFFFWGKSWFFFRTCCIWVADGFRCHTWTILFEDVMIPMWNFRRDFFYFHIRVTTFFQLNFF